MNKRYSIVLLAFITILALGSIVNASDIIVSGFEDDSIQFTFTNPRFVTYNNRYSFSIDFEAKVVSSFLSRDIEFAKMSLTMLDGQITKILSVNPSFLNSTTFGTIIELDINGNAIETAATIGGKPIKSIKVKSGESHRGTLLFHLPNDFAMIQAINYGKGSGDIRLAQNVYIDITEDDMNINSIKAQLVSTVIPTHGHMIILNIHTWINQFTKLNEPLKSAW